MARALCPFPVRTVALLFFGLSLVHATTYNFTTIQFPGAGITIPYGINNAGEVVGSFVTVYGTSPHGFTYSAGSYTQLDDPNCNAGTVLLGINDAGVIVGDCLGIPFIYRNGAFSYINSANSIYPQAINNDNVIVGWHVVLSTPESSFILVGGKALNKSFQAPGCTDTQAYGISNSNVMVGAALPEGGSAQQAFIEQNGTFSFYQYPNLNFGTSTVFSGINKSGVVAGYLSSSEYQPPLSAFVFQNGTFSPIQPPFDATSSGAFAINDSGGIVGSYLNVLGSTFGFLAMPQD